MEAEGRLFPIIREMGGTESPCALEPNRALHGISTTKWLMKFLFTEKSSKLRKNTKIKNHHFCHPDEKKIKKQKQLRKSKALEAGGCLAGFEEC